MSLDEQELRQRLEAAAAQASASRLTVETLTRRIRRRRAKIIAAVSGALLAVAAVAVAVPVALSAPGTPQPAHPAKLPFQLSFTVAVNGRSRVSPKNGSLPSFTVTPGEHLKIRTSVIVPEHHTVTALWLGVAKGAYGPVSGQRPIGMHPILVHTSKPLTPGLHTFRLTWTVPAQLSRGTSLLLVAAWETKQQEASVAQPVAELVMSR